MNLKEMTKRENIYKFILTRGVSQDDYKDHFEALFFYVKLGVIIYLKLLFYFIKSEIYEKYMPWLGVAIRGLMFIGFTMEFAHHTKISPLLSY